MLTIALVLLMASIELVKIGEGGASQLVVS